MPKRLLCEAFESFLGTHVDPGKDEERKGTKAEMEGKLQNMLKILKEEDNDGKEQLQNLIADFHKHYQSLYEHYDHLTEELRKKAYGKHEKDSSSSRSDSSELDVSPRKKGTNDGKVESNFEFEMAGIKQELEKALFEVADFRRQLTDAINEKESLDQELQGAQRIITRLNAEAEIWDVKKSKLLAENADLNTELESTRKLQAELNQKLEDVNRERKSLSIAKEAAESKIEEEKRKSEELRTINGQLQHEKHALEVQVELEVVKREFSTLREKLEPAEYESNQIQKVAEEEKSGLSLKISQLEDTIKHAENKIQDLVTESSQLSEKLAEKEIAKLNQMLEDATNNNTALVSVVSELGIDVKESQDQVQFFVGKIGRLSKIVAEETRRLSIHQETHEAYKKTASKLVKDLRQQLDSAHAQQREIEKQKDDELCALLKKHEDQKLNLLNQVDDLKAQINSAQAETESLRIHNRELESQIVNQSNEASAQVKDLTYQINAKQIELDKALEDKENLAVEVWKSAKMVKEKEDGVIAIQEEKREAIRQLCTLMDHYRHQLDYHEKFCPGGVHSGERLLDNLVNKKKKKIFLFF